MADGADLPIPASLPTSPAEALVHLAIRLGGMEQALRSSVTHEKLIAILNDQRREVTTAVRDSESHIRSLMEAQAVANSTKQAEFQDGLNTRLDNYFVTLDTLVSTKAVAAVVEALNKRDADEEKARKAIDNKTADATRGFRTIMTGGGAVLGGALMLGGLFILKMTLGWSPFG